VGDVVDGKYRVERVLGAGGMGVVVLAENLALGSRVALKLLSAEAQARPDRLERLRREARAAARLEGEHVARVLDLGGIGAGAARPYIVLEYLDGEDLAAHLARHGRMTIARAIDVVLEASEAIAEAHARGIVHRDIKPANLFLARRADGGEIVKVLDFGIAKHCEPEDAAAPLTRTNDMLGSPRYMSPEQLRNSGDVTGRCDLWALGVVLLEAVSGVPAFEADSAADLAVAILSQPLPIPRARRPDLPQPVEAAIVGCLERDAARRIATVAELAKRIAPFGSDRARASLEVIKRWSSAASLGTQTLDGPPSRRLPLDETLSKSAVGTATTGPASAIDDGARRWPPRATTAAALALALALGGALVAYWPRGAPAPRPAADSVTADSAPAPSPVVAPPTAADIADSASAAGPAPDASATASAVVVAARPQRAVKKLVGAPRSADSAATGRSAIEPARVANPTSASEPCPDPNCSRK
jgi:serine/threonine-protein kinase